MPVLSAAEEVMPGDCPANIVTPDLIYELVNHGNLATHFLHLHGTLHTPGWHHRSCINTEIEFGSMLSVVSVGDAEPAAPAPPEQTGGCPASQKQLPLLLRAFRRQPQVEPAPEARMSTRPG